jgi:hypothetical protein
MSNQLHTLTGEPPVPKEFMAEPIWILAIKINAYPSWDPGPWLLSLYSVRFGSHVLLHVRCLDLTIINEEYPFASD